MTTLRGALARLVDRLGVEEAPPGVDTEAVVAPSTVAEAAEVLTAAAGAGLRVGFHGGGTHPAPAGRSVDLVMVPHRLTGVIDYQPEDLTVVVEAGMRVADLEAMLAERRLTAVLPEAPGAATVGGTVASGASGWRRLRYGPTRDRVLEVVLATGYGEVVRGGGRVVKNVTGYDLPRLVTGSYGALGFIGSVCFKLWPMPPTVATVVVDDPAAAREACFRPLAVVETEDAAWVVLGGTPQQVDAEAADLGGRLKDGARWPDPLHDPVRLSLRVPPLHLTAAVGVVRERLGTRARLRAAHGVGTVEVGLGAATVEEVHDLREWAEAHRGALVAWGVPDVDPWGTPRASLPLQRAVKAAFDPAGVCNPGVLPEDER